MLGELTDDALPLMPQRGCVPARRRDTEESLLRSGGVDRREHCVRREDGQIGCDGARGGGRVGNDVGGGLPNFTLQRARARKMGDRKSSTARAGSQCGRDGYLAELVLASDNCSDISDLEPVPRGIPST